MSTLQRPFALSLRNEQPATASERSD